MGNGGEAVDRSYGTGGYTRGEASDERHDARENVQVKGCFLRSEEDWAEDGEGDWEGEHGTVEVVKREKEV